MARRRLLLLGCLLLALAGCQAPALDEGRDEVEGRIILWHSWSEAEADLLATALAEFAEINPGIVVVDVPIEPQELFSRFEQAGQQGIGPDLLIGPDAWIRELADEGLIRPYPAASARPISSLAREAVTYQGETYALPLFLEPYALYYNQALVDAPPTSLDELLEEAAAGNQVAFVPRFDEAYWGIQAFGPDLFDAEGNLDTVNSGFIPWLEWLTVAQEEPNVILSVDDTSLQELFVQGRVAYYVAGPERQAALRADMADPFGVTTLPSGPSGPSGPLLLLEAILFYSFSPDEEGEMAQLLGEFLSNQPQSIRFMRELDKVPANPQVNVDSRLYPTVAGFAQQANTAVVFPNERSTTAVDAAGDRAYAAVLSGAATPTEAACTFGQEVAAAEGLTAAQVTLPAGCPLQAPEDE